MARGRTWLLMLAVTVVPVGLAAFSTVPALGEGNAILHHPFSDPRGGPDHIGPGSYLEYDLGGRLLSQMSIEHDGTGVVVDPRGVIIGTIDRDDRGDLFIRDIQTRHVRARLATERDGTVVVRDTHDRVRGTIRQAAPGSVVAMPVAPGARLYQVIPGGVLINPRPPGDGAPRPYRNLESPDARGNAVIGRSPTGTPPPVRYLAPKPVAPEGAVPVAPGLYLAVPND